MSFQRLVSKLDFPSVRSASKCTQTLRRRKSCRVRRGVAVVEFAVVAPFLILIVLGMIEIGRMTMVMQILTNASREGTRRAIVEGATQSEVEAHVRDYLSNTSVSGASVTVSPANLSNVGFGDPVIVTVAIPSAKISWTGTTRFLAGKTLEASTMMQGERLQ